MTKRINSGDNKSDDASNYLYIDQTPYIFFTPKKIDVLFRGEVAKYYYLRAFSLI